MAGPAQQEVFRFMGHLARILPERWLYLLIRYSVVSLVFWPEGARRQMRCVFRRVLAFQGQATEEPALERLTREFADFYATTLVNLCLLCRKPENPETPKPVSLDLLPALRKLRRKGRGVILATPHMGDLYLMIAALAWAGIPLKVLMVGGSNYHWSEIKGLRFLDLGLGATELLRALKNNEAVLIYSDLDYFPGSRTADFFGAPAYPPHGTARLALAAGSPILPAYSVYREGAYHVLGDEPILPGPGATQEEIERRLLRSMERFIGRYPAQWLIFNDIWDLEGIKRHNYLNFQKAPA